MLVAPDDEVEEGGEEALGDVVGGAALGSVLVENQQVEPALSILLRPLELNLQQISICVSDFLSVSNRTSILGSDCLTPNTLP